MSPLARSILRTVCFADAINAALTPVEIQRLLGIDQGEQASITEVLEALRQDKDLQNSLVFANGFVTLKNRQGLVGERLKSMAVAEEKWCQALRGLRRLRFLPWIKLAAVCNTVAMDLPQRGSDIDLFLVAKAGRLWSVRLMILAMLIFSGLARRGSQVADRVCVSFSVTTKALGLAEIAKKPSDPYLSVWLATLYPVIDRHHTYKQLLDNNPWLRQQMPCCPPRQSALPHTLKFSPWAGWCEFVCRGRVFNLLDQQVKKFQYRRIFSNAQSRLHQEGTDVIVTDDILKFHEEDKREQIRKAFQARCQTYGV